MGEGVGETEGDGVGDTEAEGLGVGVGETSGEGVGLTVGVGDGVALGLADGVGIGLTVGVGLGVGEIVGVGLGLTSGVGEGEGLTLGEGEGEASGTSVSVDELVFCGSVPWASVRCTKSWLLSSESKPLPAVSSTPPLLILSAVDEAWALRSMLLLVAGSVAAEVSTSKAVPIPTLSTSIPLLS